MEAVRRHGRLKEKMDDACKEERRRYERERTAALRAANPIPDQLPPHGTYERYLLHQRSGKRPCEPCKSARDRHWGGLDYLTGLAVAHPTAFELCMKRHGGDREVALRVLAEALARVKATPAPAHTANRQR